VSGAQFLARETLLDSLKFVLSNFYDPPPPDLQGSFDIVHIRFVVGAIHGGDLVPVLDHPIQLLKPSGILQWDEAALGEPPLKYPPSHSSDVFIELFNAVLSKSGSNMNVNDWVGKLGSMFQERGLQLVEERRGGEFKKEMWKYWGQIHVVS
jgi:hypothetical protein